jgi:hypothetical protein
MLVRKVVYSGLKQGDRVRHAVKTDWGIGEVLADQVGDHVKVIFEDADCKTFSCAHTPFQRVTGEEADSEYLTTLVKRQKKASQKPSPKVAPKAMSIDAAIGVFLKHFPLGFEDSKYAEAERDYKLDAHERLTASLNLIEFDGLLSDGQYDEVVARSTRVVGRTNLISPFEQTWLRNGLSTSARKQMYAIRLHDLLYGTDEYAIRFERFAQMLYEIEAATWPLATCLPYLVHPDRRIFLKPVVTKNAAAVFGVNIHYESTLNRATLEGVDRLAETIRTQLLGKNNSALRPRDLIDIQSFIWVIGAY